MLALASPLECGGVNRRGCVFFGDGERLLPRSSPQRSHKLPVVRATVKRTKDYTLDKVIERQKRVKLVTKVRNVLVKHPGKVMTLRELARYRSHFGEAGNRKMISLIRKFPAVFRIFEEGAGNMYFGLSPAAEEQYREEMELKRQLEDSAVFRLRKLLMMSVDHRILVSKIVHLRQDLGLPLDFDRAFVQKYPEFFASVQTPLGTALEVKLWDPELAVTFDQKKMEAQVEDYEELTVSGRVPRFPRITLPKGYKLPRKERVKLLRFQSTHLVSPYESPSGLHPASRQAERRAVAVVQELLHLTVEKKTLVDNLTHFRSDFKFSQQVRGMLIRHPEIFYVSFKGDRDSVFLREAYDAKSQLIVKDPLVIAKEKLAALAKIDPRALRLRQQGRDPHEDDGDEDDDLDDDEDEDAWSDDDEDNSEAKQYLDEIRRRKEVAFSLRPKVEPW